MAWGRLFYFKPLLATGITEKQSSTRNELVRRVSDTFGHPV